jgi:hypothetical protein
MKYHLLVPAGLDGGAPQPFCHLFALHKRLTLGGAAAYPGERGKGTTRRALPRRASWAARPRRAAYPFLSYLPPIVMQ